MHDHTLSRRTQLTEFYMHQFRVLSFTFCAMDVLQDFNVKLSFAPFAIQLYLDNRANERFENMSAMCDREMTLTCAFEKVDIRPRNPTHWLKFSLMFPEDAWSSQRYEP